MLPKDTQIFASYHMSDEKLVQNALEQIKAAGWNNAVIDKSNADNAVVSGQIEQSGMFVVFLSKAFAQDDRLMLEEFAYASTIVHKPFLPVWLDSLTDIQHDYETALTESKGKGLDNKRQLISALEMITAKHSGTTAEGLVDALVKFIPDIPPYTPSTPQVCEKPCEAYEGDEPYIFISYAHDDAKRVYPVVKELFEEGRDLWYDEGIKTTERYLPVISDHVKRSEVFVLMLTNRCLERPFVMNYELEFAKQLGIPVVPVLLEFLTPPDYAKEIVEELQKTAITPETLLEHIRAFNLPPRGIRIAIPPAIKQNVVYDVVLPPELPGFEYSTFGNEITITKYVGLDTEVVIPSKVTSANGEMTWHIINFSAAFENVKHPIRVIISEGFTTINAKSFTDCKTLIGVTIPEGISSIGEKAFQHCAGLKTVTIPKSVRNIGLYAFHGCNILSEVKILGNPEAGKWAFYYCPKLGIVINMDGTILYQYPEKSTQHKYVIPKSVKVISATAFNNCNSLKCVVIPEGVTNIGDDAFTNCSSLSRIVLPSSIKTIGSSAFHTTNLVKIKLPDSLTSIEYGTFSCCNKLKKVGLPDTIVSIGEAAFFGCKALKKIKLPNSVTHIHSQAFENCRNLKKINVPESVSYIGENAFIGTPQNIPSRGSLEITEKKKSLHSEIPYCEESPYSLICCPKEDLQFIRYLLIELYWEGFNIRYEEIPDEHIIMNSECILVFFTENTKISQTALNILKKAIQKDVSRIIQVFLDGCSDWPDELRHNLHDRQAIMQNLCTNQEFTGRIRQALRGFGCFLGHPRGFDVKVIGNSVEIARFHSTGFPVVMIPKTFYDPPLPVTSIGHGAFQDDKITSIIIPEGVTNIAYRAFDSCFIGFGPGYSLNEVVLPESLKTISVTAFWECRELKHVIFPAVIDTSLRYDEIFHHCFSWKKGSSILTIHTPAGSNAADLYANDKSVRCITYTPEEWKTLRNSLKCLKKVAGFSF